MCCVVTFAYLSHPAKHNRLALSIMSTQTISIEIINWPAQYIFGICSFVRFVGASWNLGVVFNNGSLRTSVIRSLTGRIRSDQSLSTSSINHRISDFNVDEKVALINKPSHDYHSSSLSRAAADHSRSFHVPFVMSVRRRLNLTDKSRRLECKSKSTPISISSESSNLFSFVVLSYFFFIIRPNRDQSIVVMYKHVTIRKERFAVCRESDEKSRD